MKVFDHKATSNAINKAILDYREKHNLNNKQMAQRLGVPVCTIAGWTVKKACPRADSLVLLMSVLDKKFEDLVKVKEI